MKAKLAAIAASLLLVASTFAGSTASAAPTVPESPALAQISLPCPGVVKIVDPLALPCLSSSDPTPPTPHMPGSGLSGELDGTPAPGKSLYSQYGYSNLHFDLYNEPSVISHPSDLGEVTNASADNMIGGWMFGTAVDIVALGNSLGRLIDPPTFLKALDKLISNGTAAMQRAVWTPFLPLALIIVGLGIVVTGWRRQDTARAFRSAFWALGVLGLVSYVALFSVQVGVSADSLVSTTVDTIYSAVDGQSQSTPAAAGSLEEQDVLYPMWLLGELGSSTSQTAVTYGPKLFQANGYSWAQTGGNGKKAPSAATTKKLAGEWTAAAKDIKASDPAAYDHLTDANAGRFSAGLVALIAAVLTTGFRLVADFLVLAALLMIRLAVIVLPAVGVISINDRMSGMLRSLASKVGSALVSCVVFSAGAAVNVLAVGVLLSPTAGLPLFFGVILCGLVTAALWVVLKPYRHMTDLVGAAGSKVGGIRFQRRQQNRRDHKLAAAVALAAGGVVGGAAAEAVINHHERDEATPAEPVETTPTEVPERDEAIPADEPEVDDNPLHPAVDEPVREEVEPVAPEEAEVA